MNHEIIERLSSSHENGLKRTLNETHIKKDAEALPDPPDISALREALKRDLDILKHNPVARLQAQRGYEALIAEEKEREHPAIQEANA
jgi:hypothetical protein